MDSNTKIGIVTSFVIKSVTPLSETVETTLNKNLITNQDATYSQVDTAARALISISANTYSDTICVTNISVGEVLAG